MQTAQTGAAQGAGTGTPAPDSAGTATPPPAPRLGIGNGRTNGAAAAPGTGAGNDLDLDTGDTGDTGAPAWGEGWRDGLAKGDATRLRRLEKYATPDAVATALFAAQDRLTRGATLPALPDDATDDEVKAFRKAQGIPDSAKEYGLAWPEGHAATEADTAGLNAFAEFMHAKHIPPTAVKAAFEYYTSAQAAARQERAEAAHELNLQQVAELRKEYPGREFKRSMTIAEEFLAHHFEGREEALDMVLQASLPNGVQIKNFAPFISGLVAMARSYADEEALVGGDGAGGGKSIDTEYNELVTKSATTRLSNDEHKRLNELAEARQARAEKQGRRNQAA
jgi:hypothetical protein